MAPLELNSYERMPREQQKTGGLPWRMFSFALFLLILAAGAYLGLKFGYSPILENRISQLDGDLATLSEQIPEAQRVGFIQLYSQLANLQSILQKHVMTSVVFPLLERNTNTSVSYTNFDLSVPDNRLSIEGFARSYEILAQQLGAWERVPQVEKSYIAESQASEGRVRFRMVLQFVPSLFSPRAGGGVAGAFLDTEAAPPMIISAPLTSLSPTNIAQ